MDARIPVSERLRDELRKEARKDGRTYEGLLNEMLKMWRDFREE